MSRIGNMPIQIPTQTNVEVTESLVRIRGPKGELTCAIPQGISVSLQDGVLRVSCHRNDRKTRSLFGFVRAHLANQIIGVTEGFRKMLELSGVGYRASLSGNNLVLSVGFSHPVTVSPPDGITFSLSEGKIIVSGIDKQKVGQVAADIRAIKPPEPYKGKGIKYVGEVIRRKAGKAAKSVGGK